MLAILLLFFPSLCIANFICGKSITDGCLSFDGEIYNDGEMIEEACYILTCNKGTNGFTWQWKYPTNCKYCDKTINEIKTLDGNQFTMQGTNNYTLVQPLNCSEGNGTYNPRYGFYSQFESCKFPAGYENYTCATTLTFKVNEFTLLTFDHLNPSLLNINGETVIVKNEEPEILCRSDGSAFPFLIWQNTDSYTTLYIQGPNLAIFVSDYYFYIYVKPEEKNQVGGICGFYSGDKNDDFLKRNCQDAGISNLKEFLESWNASQPQPSINESSTSKTCEKEKFFIVCRNAVTELFRKKGFSLFIYLVNIVNALIGSCVEDCCEDAKSCTSRVALDINAYIRL